MAIFSCKEFSQGRQRTKQTELQSRIVVDWIKIEYLDD